MNVEPLSDDWLTRHFDHLSPDLPDQLVGSLGRLSATCPIAHSDRHGGFWVATKYDDVLRVARDWETFSSELGYTVPRAEVSSAVIPLGVDPPLHREFKRLINAYFTPAVVAPWEDRTRAIVNQLIDAFAHRGACEFMDELAIPFPGLAFFELALHAPKEEARQLTEWATFTSSAQAGDDQGLPNLLGWVAKFAQQRRSEPPLGDVVDAVLRAEIVGRPITDDEVIGTSPSVLAPTAARDRTWPG